MIRVLVNGAKGKMGSETVQAVRAAEDLELVAATGRGDDLSRAVRENRAEVVVEFTHPSVAYGDTVTALEAGAHVVLGTSGVTPAQRAELDVLARAKGRCVLLAPNFNLGAVLMVEAAARIARHLPEAEVVEYHHEGKADAPSGTALYTAERLNEVFGEKAGPRRESDELLETRSQGARVGAVRIHSVRLPGFIASQEVVFGGKGQVLTIRHDMTGREGFMPGVLLAVRKVVGRKGLVYGLEKVLDD